MAYVKITNFAIKDSTNDVIRGTEHDDEYNAIEASFVAQPSATQTLTNKTIALGSNTVSGTTAQFNTALSDGDFATLAGTETLTNKALNGTLGATTPSTVVATSITSNGATTLAGGNTTIKAGYQILLENAAGNDTYAAYNAGSTGTSTYSFRYAGVDRMTLDASGNVGIGVTPSVKLDVNGSARLIGTSTSSVSLGFGPQDGVTGWSIGNGIIDNTHTFRVYDNTAGTTRMTIDPSGNVGIGVTPSAWSVGKAVEVGQGGNGIYSYAAANSYFTMNCNYNIGWKYTASNYASYYQQINGYHQWFTAPSGTAGDPITFTQVMTLDASGRLKLDTTIGVGNATPSTSGAGITFPATQSASTDANTLDDYEEGTWTPSFGALSGSATYSGQSGTYTKIGRQVTVVFYLQIAVSSSLVSDGNINGLPFAGSNTNYAGAALSAWNGGAFNGYYCMAGLTGSASTIQLRGGTTAAPGTVVSGTSITNGTLIAGSMTYFTA